MCAVQIAIKRIYEQVEDSDGYRVLVDRLWPRGVSKERADLDIWDKVLAPSTQARVDFGHKASNFDHFKAVYRAELDANEAAQVEIKRLGGLSVERVTLLYGARDTQINHAVLLREYMMQALKLS